MQKSYRDGVFDHVTDIATFVDKIEISFWEEQKRSKMWLNDDLSAEPSFPIARLGGVYGRALNGICRVTGNPFQKRYGQLLKLPKIPSTQLVLRSCRTPLSGAQVDFISSALGLQKVRTSVSSAELTFDLTGTAVAFFKRHLWTTARTSKCLTDMQGRTTLYVGARRSPWQLRVYDKAPGIVRFEFVLRRAYLRKHGIERPCDLLRLRTMDLRKMVSLRKLDRQRIRRIESEATNYRRRALCALARYSTTKQFRDLLKRRGTRHPDFFTPCGMEAKLRLMQRRLMW